MHAKYPSTVRILLSVVLCVELVFCGVLSGNPETTTENAGEFLSEDDSGNPDLPLDYDTVSTTNYDTLEVPRSHRGTLIEEHSSINVTREPDRHNEFGNLEDTETTSGFSETNSEGSIGGTVTSAGTHAGDYPISSTDIHDAVSIEDDPTVTPLISRDFNSFLTNSYDVLSVEEKITTSSALSATDTQEVSSETLNNAGNSNSEQYIKDVTLESTSTSSTSQEEKQTYETSTENAFHSVTQTTPSEELLKNQENTQLTRSTTFPPSHGDDDSPALVSFGKPTPKETDDEIGDIYDHTTSHKNESISIEDGTNEIPTTSRNFSIFVTNSHDVTSDEEKHSTDSALSTTNSQAIVSETSTILANSEISFKGISNLDSFEKVPPEKIHDEITDVYHSTTSDYYETSTNLEPSPNSLEKQIIENENPDGSENDKIGIINTGNEEFLTTTISQDHSTNNETVEIEITAQKEKNYVPSEKDILDSSTQSGDDDTDTTMYPRQGEPIENTETTTINYAHTTPEDILGHQSSTTEESNTSVEYSGHTENTTSIPAEKETDTISYSTLTSLNLVEENTETTTDVTPTQNTKSVEAAMTTGIQTKVMSSFRFPDTSYESTESGIGLFSCYDAKISSYKITEGKTAVEVAWTLYLPNDCQLKIDLSCRSEDDDSTWTVPFKKSVSIDVDRSFGDISSHLEKLSEFTNYSCIAKLLMKTNELVLDTKNFKVTTKPEVPSIIYFDITDVTAESFFLSWQRPTKIPGNLQKYHIILKKKSNHYIRNDCNDSTEVSISLFDEREYLTHNFTNAKPDHFYQVQILAEDEAGNSTGIIKRILTNSSRSTPPLNVSSTLHYHSYHCNGDEYNATLQLKWELPCDTNGKVSKFEVKITEIMYTENNNTEDTMSEGTYEVEMNTYVNDLSYELIVENLNASCVYNVTIAAITGDDLYGLPAYHQTQPTRAGCPSEPKIVKYSSSDPFSFSLEWTEPKQYFGEILGYELRVIESGPKHKLANDPNCRMYPRDEFIENTNTTYYTFSNGLPNYGYRVSISARTSAGIGKPTREMEIITKRKASEPIRNLAITEINNFNITDEIYEYRVRITFDEPCNTNGLFRYYLMREEGRRIGYQNVFVKTKLNETSYEVILRKPEYYYEFEIKVITDFDDPSPGAIKSITSIAAIPKINENKIKCTVEEDNPTEIKVEIEKEIFSSENGEITHYDVFLFENVDENSKSQKPTKGFCDTNCSLSNKTYPFFKAKSSLRLTSGTWNPFTGGKHEVLLSIGQREHTCSNEFCRPLSENTNYVVLLRGYTRNTYRDVFYVVKTGTTSSSSVFFVVLFIIFVVIVVLGIYLYSERQRFVTIFRSIPESSEEPVLRYLVAVKHFKSYYNKTQNDPTILRKQYEEIEDEIKKYKEEHVHSTFALKPENKRKNRYTNILPYDEFRVKLQMDEDDEISSDYINASYIRGTSGKVEYIATQGPLEHTCKDFWKMVIQENVTVIVMVSQFIEKQKEKCFKYFPNNHENMMICEDLEVKCLTELQFDTHCIRTLLIRKDLKQFSVIHMQYLDWPDFGCPSGTYNMLSFCQEVRDRIQIEKGLMAVHCSAGVGRTGTLISLDMLLQTIQRKKEISIFECVMDLRKQRTHMVQTEKQYVYIYTCLNDVLENCSSYSFNDTKKDDDHIYVNVKNRAIKGPQWEEKESAF